MVRISVRVKIRVEVRVKVRVKVKVIILQLGVGFVCLSISLYLRKPTLFSVLFIMVTTVVSVFKTLALTLWSPKRTISNSNPYPKSYSNPTLFSVLFLMVTAVVSLSEILALGSVLVQSFT
jgi:hypothetical protein